MKPRFNFNDDDDPTIESPLPLNDKSGIVERVKATDALSRLSTIESIQILGIVVAQKVSDDPTQGLTPFLGTLMTAQVVNKGPLSVDTIIGVATCCLPGPDAAVAVIRLLKEAAVVKVFDRAADRVTFDMTWCTQSYLRKVELAASHSTEPELVAAWDRMLNHPVPDNMPDHVARGHADCLKLFRDALSGTST